MDCTYSNSHLKVSSAFLANICWSKLIHRNCWRCERWRMSLMKRPDLEVMFRWRFLHNPGSWHNCLHPLFNFITDLTSLTGKNCKIWHFISTGSESRSLFGFMSSSLELVEQLSFLNISFLITLPSTSFLPICFQKYRLHNYWNHLKVSKIIFGVIDKIYFLHI